MFDVPSFKLGRFFGIPVEVNATWLVIFGLVAFALATNYFPRWCAAAGARSASMSRTTPSRVTALLFFASIVAHELCHSLVVRGGRRSRRARSRCSSSAASRRWTRSRRTPGSRVRDGGRRAGDEPGAGGVCPTSRFRARRSSGAAWWIWAPAAVPRRSSICVCRRVQPAARVSRWTAAAYCARSCGLITDDHAEGHALGGARPASSSAGRWSLLAVLGVLRGSARSHLVRPDRVVHRVTRGGRPIGSNS